MKILDFFKFLWVIFALLDPDPKPCVIDYAKNSKAGGEGAQHPIFGVYCVKRPVRAAHGFRIVSIKPSVWLFFLDCSLPTQEARVRLPAGTCQAWDLLVVKSLHKMIEM